MTQATQTRIALHGRKLVLTRQQQQLLERVYNDYIAIGYPEEVAKQYAWDCTLQEARSTYVA